MILKADEAREVVYSDHRDWEMVRGTREIVDQDRWCTTFEAVFLQKSTGKHYQTSWTKGSTEVQDERPFEDDEEVEFTEVHQVEKMVKVWEAVK